MTDKTERDIVLNEFNRDFQFEDSDLTIRSSDNAIFRVHRFHLMSVSAVFRDMITIGEGQTGDIILTTENLEDSSTIAMFLQFTYGKPLKQPTSYEHKPYQRLFLLGYKYDCPGLSRLLEALTYQWYIEGHFCPRNVFVMGYTLRKVSLAVYGLRNAANWCYKVDKSVSRIFYTWRLKASSEDQQKSRDRIRSLEGVAGCSTFDLSALSLHSFEELPDSWKFALLRATWGRIKDGDLGKTDWEKIADDFEKIYKMIHEETA